ncbi:PRTRC system protein C, partial [Serratia marcescens]|uniref:PRTRC system protein C n=1 Tax=Serratia marcescens TaxID=615 RepID=UPI0013DB20E3
LKPVYRYDGRDLDVPDHLQGDQNALRNYHAILYPAVATAELVEVGPKDQTYVYEYRRTVGTKGAA